jgi:uncharacterized Zn finger protein
MFCSYRCEFCADAECLSEGCKHDGEPPLAPCENCGELYIIAVRADFCSDCLEKDTHSARPEIVPI